MLRRRTFLYAALALAVPLPAFALSGGDAPASDTLSVSASLDGCGIAASNVVCKIDASWNAVAGADRYTASVSSPDGAVSDYGDFGGTGTSIWVPYVGNGTYTVTISAWGTPPGADKPVVLTKQRATAADTSGNARPDTPQDFSNGAGGSTSTGDPGAGSGTGSGTTPSGPGSDPPPPNCDPATSEPPATTSDSASPPVVDGSATPPPDGCPVPPPVPPTTTTTTTTTTTPEGG